MYMFIGTMRNYVSQILLSTIPTFLFHMLETCIELVLRLRRLLQSFHKGYENKRRVYDLGNCGSNHRFMVGLKRPMLAHNCQYGAGVGKIMETLENDNIYLPEDQVRAVWETYWELFAEVKALARNLEDEWRRNGGYILNGLGLPMCVDRDSKKDILNRFIQSTGHDILIKYIRIYTEELTRREIPWLPHVLDWHDASAVEVPETYLNQTIEVYKWGLDELNRQLGGTIRLKGTPSFGPTMADIKEPEE